MASTEVHKLSMKIGYGECYFVRPKPQLYAFISQNSDLDIIKDYEKDGLHTKEIFLANCKPKGQNNDDDWKKRVMLTIHQCHGDLSVLIGQD